MAVDTAKKRFSMMNFSNGSSIPFAAPSGSVTGGDKQHLLDCYSGIAFNTPAGGGTVIVFKMTLLGVS